MKEFIKLNLTILVIMTATLIPLWVCKSIWTQSLDLKEFVVIYLSMILCIIMGTILVYIISPILSKIEEL